MKTKLLYALLAFVIIFNFSCDDSEDSVQLNTEAMELPPYESMAIDLSGFLEDSSGTDKSIASTAKLGDNWTYPRVVVGFWNTVLFTNLAIPVASFQSAFNHEAEFLGESTWQWSYTVDGFASEYTARLTGELTDDGVIWEMYVTKVGTDPFDEFLWFSGVSDLDGNAGEWVLYQSPENPVSMINITWSRENDEIGNIRYTWIRELDAEEGEDLYYGSYLEYGLQEGDYNVFYNIHVYDSENEDFVDVNIEWSQTEYYGRVMAYTYFGDEDWHCWDSTGADVSCE